MNKRAFLRSIILIVLSLLLIGSGNAEALDQSTIYLPVSIRDGCPDFFDDFSDPASGWHVVDAWTVRKEYLDGEYRILTKDNYYGYYYGLVNA